MRIEAPESREFIKTKPTAFKVGLKAKETADVLTQSEDVEKMQLDDALMSHANRLLDAGVPPGDVNKTCYRIEETYWNCQKPVERAAHLNFLQGLETTEANLGTRNNPNANPEITMIMGEVKTL